MKKFLLLVVAVLGFATASSAQTFDVGTQNITALAGFGNGDAFAVALSYEQGIYSFAAEHKLGLGAYAVFGDSTFAPAVECNYHYVGINKLDLYGGVRLGYAFVGDGYFYDSFDIGANYFLNSSWAITAEIGSGLGALNLGVTYSF